MPNQIKNKRIPKPLKIQKIKKRRKRKKPNWRLKKM